jgi:hypothetical protein
VSWSLDSSSGFGSLGTDRHDPDVALNARYTETRTRSCRRSWQFLWILPKFVGAISPFYLFFTWPWFFFRPRLYRPEGLRFEVRNIVEGKCENLDVSEPQCHPNSLSEIGVSFEGYQFSTFTIHQLKFTYDLDSEFLKRCRTFRADGGHICKVTTGSKVQKLPKPI